MKQNIFENAKFGDKFRTRDDRKAIYLADVTNDMSDLHRIYVEGADRGENYLYVHSSGRVLKDIQNALDIVSEWQESINEEELDKLANEYACKYSDPYTYQRTMITCGFKAGYRAAMEITNKCN